MRTILYAETRVEEDDIKEVVKTLENGWLGPSKKCHEFELELCKANGVKHGALVNSCSSANYLALATLKETLTCTIYDDELEVITCACGFPTTVAPIVQNGFAPVFVDVNIDTLNILEEDIVSKISQNTAAVFFANTLGDIANLELIDGICKSAGIMMIQDNCDAFGSTYKNKPLGNYGDIVTNSFYPAHHVSMLGGGGFVGFNDSYHVKIAKMLRDWGMSCGACNYRPACNELKNGVCGNRYDDHLKIGKSVDKRYCFDIMGYNFGSNECGAAFGLNKLKKFQKRDLDKRKQNFLKLYAGLYQWKKYIKFQESSLNVSVSPFAFAITVMENELFNRDDLVKHFEDNGILCRMIFGGNLLRHKGFENLGNAEEYPNSDYVLKNSFFIGCHPYMSNEDIKYIIEKFEEFMLGRLKN